MPSIRCRAALAVVLRAAGFSLALGGALAARPAAAQRPTSPPPARSSAAPHAATRTLAARLGYPLNAKLLILHADDLGVAHSEDSASFDALEHGLVTSASIMMPTPWVTEVAAWARRHPDHDLGLHLTLTSEWTSYRWGSVAPASEVRSLLDSTGTMPAESQAVATRAAPAEVERELRAEVERARAMGIEPTHLDSHMGALFTTPQLFAALMRVAHDYRIPYLFPRQALALVPPGTVTDRDVIVDAVIVANPTVARDRWTQFYVDAVRHLQPGLTEIIVHLGRDDDEMRAVMVDHEPYGAAWRQRDAEAMRSPEFRQALKDAGVVLVRWKDLKRLAAGA